MQRNRFGVVAAAVAVMLTLSVAAFAQNEQGAQRQGNRGTRGVSLATVPVVALSAALKLTDEQKTKITAIHDKYAEDAKALRPAPGAQPDPANREKRRELTNKANADIEAVLNDEQKAKLKDVLQEMGMLRSAGIPLELVGDLKLTDDQKKQMAAIMADTQEKMRGLSPEDRRAKGREMMQEARTKMEAVLTDEQKAMIEKYRKEHPPEPRTGSGA